VAAVAAVEVSASAAGAEVRSAVAVECEWRRRLAAAHKFTFLAPVDRFTFLAPALRLMCQR
jgi:hypothetical protein